MDLNSLIQLKRERFEQLEGEISDPRLFDNRKRAEEIMREHANLKDLLEKSRATSKSRPWLTMKFRSSKNASLILNAMFRSRWCQRINRTSATQSWKFGPA